MRKIWSHCLFQIALLTVITAAVYYNSFEGIWQFDDEKAILENHRIKRLENIPGILQDYLSRSVLWVTFALNYHFGGVNPWGYHLVNLMLHLSVVFFIYFISYRLALLGNIDQEYFPFFSALIFAVHPINTESVTYIISRSSVLTTFFYLMAFLLIISAARRRKENEVVVPLLYFLLVVFLFALGLGTKEIIITLPVMAFLYLYIFVEETESLFAFVKKYKWILGFFVLAVVLYLLYRHTHGGVAITLAVERGVRSIHVNFLTEMNVIVFYYLPRLFVPIRLNVDPDFPIAQSSLELLRSAFSALVLVGLVTLAVANLKKARVLSFGILWFLITIGPTSSFIPLLDVAAEHRVYLPGMGFSICLVYALFKGFQHIASNPKYQRIFAMIPLSILVLLFSLGTVRRNTVYRSQYALWKDTVAKSPKKWRPHNNLADAYEKMGRFEEAEREYRLILGWDENNVRAHYGLGNVYRRTRRFGEAVGEYRRALEIKPDFEPVYNNLGIVYDDLGMDQEAEEAYKKALKINPNFLKPYNNLAVVYAKRGDYEGALSMINQALARDPRYVIGYNTLGNIYLNQKAYDEAISALQKSVEIKPDFLESYYTLGEAYRAKGDYEGALKMYEAALRLDSRSGLAYRSLGVIYLYDLKDAEKASYYLQKALEVNPDIPGAETIRSAIQALESSD